MHFPTDLLFFGISLTDLLFFALLYYYINLSLSMLFSHFSRDIYLFFFGEGGGGYFYVSLSTVSELFCGQLLETFVILSAIYCRFRYFLN